MKNAPQAWEAARRVWCCYPARLPMMMTMCCMAASLDWRPYEHQTRTGARDVLGVIRLDDQ
jgi:hypothetical protein